MANGRREMSIWTQINGSIRYDDIRAFEAGLLEKYKRALGNVVEFDDPEQKWDKCNVPLGSEGSLQWKLIENPDESSLAAYTVLIWGSLRNYSDLDEIGRWFCQCILQEGFSVRQGILHAKVEGGEEVVWLVTKSEGKTVVSELSPEKSKARGGVSAIQSARRRMYVVEGEV